MIDTHAHLDCEDYESDYREVLDEAFAGGVEAVIIPATNRAGFERIEKIAESDSRIFFASGIHPHDSADFTPECEQEIRTLAEHGKCKAIGEIGLDYFYDFHPKDLQKDVFRRQVSMARELGLPMIIHNRLADDDILEILEDENNLHGVMHCFSSTPKVAAKVLEHGMMLSFTGSVTFKKSNLAPVVEMVPMDRIMLETDSPYMTPVPYRGRRNNPIYTRLIAEKIAEIKQINIEEVIKMTTENAKKFFKLVLPMLVLMLVGGVQMYAQEYDEFEDDEEIVYQKPDNPYHHQMFGIGGFIGTNTVVETYDINGGDQEISYDGMVNPGVILTVMPMDFLRVSFSYSYAKNQKISDNLKGAVGPTTHNILELGTQWIVNPRNRINFGVNLGLNMIMNTRNKGGKSNQPEEHENNLGLTAGVGIIGNVKIGRYGMLNITAGWDVMFPFSKTSGYLWSDEAGKYVPTEASAYFSVPKFGLIFYPNIY